MAGTPPVVLSIAGFDPASGAGVTADIKTIAAHGCYGVACITGLTIQSTQGVRQVQPVAPELVRRTLENLLADLNLAATRIGMLASAKVAAAVADFLASAGLPNVVLDPVLKASSGADLLNPAGLDVLRERLLPLATLITPNSDEAACLIGLPVSSLDQMKTAAQRLHTMGARNVVVTGGHLPGATDLLSTESGTQEVLAGKRLRSASTHGTGCAFATALACNLALGEELSAAARHAKSFVSTAIQEAYPVGKGTGPINHLYRLKR